MKTSDGLGKNHEETAAALFYKGYSCAQAVLCAFCGETGLSEETAIRLAAPFGAGMGRMREVCGACSAMFMIAGLLRAPEDPLDAKQKAEHYALIQRLAAGFKELHGTIVCRELLKNQKTDTSPVPQKRDETYYRERPCAVFVRDAVRLTEQMLSE